MLRCFGFGAFGHRHRLASPRRWAPRHFVELGLRLQRQGYEPVFILAPHERPDWTCLTDAGLAIQQSPSLADVAAFIHECGWFIGNESGIGHLALWVSQTRSSWALLVVFGLVYLLTKRQWTRRTKLVFLGGLMVAMAIVAAVSWYAKDSRWQKVVSDLNRYEQHDRDTSVGIRIQLWKASWLMFKESPLVGVGVPNFRAELVKLQQQGVVTEEVAVGYGEPHNDMLGALSGYGLLGLLSILALYLIPAAIFWRRSASDDPVVHVGSQIGLLFCLGYFVFSMSEMMFRNMRSVPIYALTVVVLYALTSARTGLAQQRLAARR